MNWYVLYVKGGSEKKLEKFFHDNELNAFIPMMEKMHKKNGEYVEVTAPMFPSYLFVKSDLDQKDFNLCLLKLRSQRSGIVKQLKYDNEGTSALREDEKALLERLMDEEHVVKHSKAIIEGDQIIVMEGPLQGMESRIVKIDRHKRLAYLACELLGRPVRISMEVVKKI